MIKKILLLGFISFIFNSCGLKKELPMEVSESLISIHRIDQYNFNTQLTTPITVDGQKFFISKIPLLSNADMMYATPFQYLNDQWGLDVHLTRTGANRWTQSQVEFRGMTAVMVEGGKFKCFIKIGNGGSGLDYKIAAPLTKEEADKISKNIARNYEAIKELN